MAYSFILAGQNPWKFSHNSVISRVHGGIEIIQGVFRYAVMIL